MRRKRTLIVVLAVLLVIAGIAFAVWLRHRAVPEPVRLLPNADAYFYVNLKPLRQAGVIGKQQPRISDDPEYQNFLNGTGFNFERDLDEAAFAVHYPPSESGARTGAYRHPRFSEVFVGNYNYDRVSKYFRKISSSVERYNDTDIYSIPLEGRTVRVALLGLNMAAVTNTDGIEIIHGMIDRHKEWAMPFSGPALINDYKAQIPWATLAWAIVRVAPSPQPNSNMLVLPGGFDLFFPAGTVIVGSIRYTGSVQFKIDAFTAGEDEARRITEQTSAFLNIFRTLQTSSQLGGGDQDVKAFFDSLQIEQEGKRVVLNAQFPEGFLRKMLEEPPTSEVPSLNTNPQLKPEPKPAPPHKGSKGKSKH